MILPLIRARGWPVCDDTAITFHTHIHSPALITIHDGCSCWQFGHLSVCLKISCDVAWKEITWMRIIFPNLILLPQLTCISQHAMICFRGSYTVLICSGAIFSCLNSHFVEDSGTVRAFKNHLISELTWVLHVSVL